MLRSFEIIDNLGFNMETIAVNVPETATLDEAAAEARAQFEADLRSAYDAGNQYKADAVIASIGEVKWIMPRLSTPHVR